MAEQIETPDVPDLCARLVKQLDPQTRDDLRMLVFILAASVKGTNAEGYLAAMYDYLEPPGN